MIYYASIFLVGLLDGLISPNSEGGISLILLLPVIWFFIAQSAKRCHDRGNSGWFQLIPFYILWMLFAEGDSGLNEYGPDPKDNGRHHNEGAFDVIDKF